MKKYFVRFGIRTYGIISVVVSSFTGLLIAADASAQSVVAGGTTGKTPAIQLSSSYDVVTKILCPTFDFMFWILIAVSMIMVIFAAFEYATAGDDTEKTTRARKTLTWAAVGIAVALLAKGFPMLVGSIYGTGGTGTELAACAGF